MTEYKCSLDERVNDGLLNDIIELSTWTTESRRSVISQKLEMLRKDGSDVYLFLAGHFNNCSPCSERYRHLQTIDYALEISQDL